MRIVCQQTILMKYALFVIFEKAAEFIYCRLLQITGGALRVMLVFSLCGSNFLKVRNSDLEKIIP